MSNFGIRVITTEEELLEKYDGIKQVPLINILPRELLIKCLQGSAIMICGTKDQEDLGVAIIERHGDNMSLLAVNAKNHAKKLMLAFYSWAFDLGIKRITMMSAFDRESYERLFEVKHLTSIYEKDLTEWQQ